MALVFGKLIFILDRPLAVHRLKASYSDCNALDSDSGIGGNDGISIRVKGNGYAAAFAGIQLDGAAIGLAIQIDQEAAIACLIMSAAGMIGFRLDAFVHLNLANFHLGRIGIVRIFARIIRRGDCRNGQGNLVRCMVSVSVNGFNLDFSI